MIIVSVLRAAESDAGPFTLAETRVVCRSGARGRGFHVSDFIDGEEAARLLARRWGYRARPAAVALRLRYHGAAAEVRADGRLLLDARLLDPVPLAPADLRFTDSMHLARTPRGSRSSRSNAPTTSRPPSAAGRCWPPSRPPAGASPGCAPRTRYRPSRSPVTWCSGRSGTSAAPT
ncbi:hypothetical protein ACFQ3Z_07155 [Streptomyces nogalater]